MSFLNSIPSWGWFDIGFNIIVLVALGGETNIVLSWIFPYRAGDLLPPKKKQQQLKKWCEWLLIFGIAGEISCLPFSLYGTADAENKAGQANERASTSELQVAVLTNETVSLSIELEKLRNDNLTLQDQLISVSNSAAMNSPSNFPISSVQGDGFIIIRREYAPLVAGLENKRVIL